jgi:cyclopropane fatty-acyl-phospholipid synthase-like methyltransferase
MMDAGDRQRPGGPGPPRSDRDATPSGEYTPGTSGYDAELRRHNEVLRRAVGVQLHEHVLDIGCGTGQSMDNQNFRAAEASI